MPAPCPVCGDWALTGDTCDSCDAAICSDCGEREALTEGTLCAGCLVFAVVGYDPSERRLPELVPCYPVKLWGGGELRDAWKACRAAAADGWESPVVLRWDAVSLTNDDGLTEAERAQLAEWNQAEAGGAS